MSLKKNINKNLIKCACGCKKQLTIMNNYGYIRKFIHGHNKAHFNFKHSKETKEKMRLARTGKKLSIEHRKKISLNSGQKGEKNVHWKGGVTQINETIRKSIDYKLWREANFKRDNYTCVECKQKEVVSGKLNAHHIKPFSLFPELRFAIDNGITLCAECHKKTDTYLSKIKTYKSNQTVTFDYSVFP